MTKTVDKILPRVVGVKGVGVGDSRGGGAKGLGKGFRVMGVKGWGSRGGRGERGRWVQG